MGFNSGFKGLKFRCSKELSLDCTRKLRLWLLWKIKLQATCLHYVYEQCIVSTGRRQWVGKSTTSGY